VQSALVVQRVEQMQPGEKPPQHRQLVLVGHRIPAQFCHVQRKPEIPSLAPPSRCAGAQLQVGVSSTQTMPLQALRGQTAEPSAHVWHTPVLGQSASLVQGRVGAPAAPATAESASGVPPAAPLPIPLLPPPPRLRPALAPALPLAPDGCSRLTEPAQANDSTPARLDSASAPSPNFWPHAVASSR
jgi:hypothetical protein